MISLSDTLLEKVDSALVRFIDWHESFGETSYDHQSFFSGPFGRKAKSLFYTRPFMGKFAVAPMVFCEAFAPELRRLFGNALRFPIADAHYAMGFAYLFQFSKREEYYRKASHFLGKLVETRCSNYSRFCWGYPFDWVTRNGTIARDTPLITTTPYAYEAFLQLYQIDKKSEWLRIIRSIVNHVLRDIKDTQISRDSYACSYTPHDSGGVVNASAYRAFLLTSASILFSEERLWKVAERNLNFVLRSQLVDGSWPYAIDGERDFVDHFHTCFVLKALAKIDQLKAHTECEDAISRGVRFYLEKLFDKVGLPKPFSKPPRITVYRSELYDYAECINLACLLRGRFSGLDNALIRTLEDLLLRWRKPDASFRSRRLLIGWDNVPMHRWAQSQLFRSLALFLFQSKKLKKQERGNSDLNWITP